MGTVMKHILGMVLWLGAASGALAACITLMPTNSSKFVTCGTAWSFDQPTLSYNCDCSHGLTPSFSVVTNGASGAGNCQVQVATWGERDDCGNSAQATETVTIINPYPIVFQGVANIVV